MIKEDELLDEEEVVKCSSIARFSIAVVKGQGSGD